MDRLTESARLGADLHLGGLDAEDFMAEFADEFRVDMCTFQFDRHFKREPNGLLLPLDFLRMLIGIVFPSMVQELSDVTVRDLVRAAESGVWTVDASRVG